MAFEANKKTIYELLNDISYSIPVNQRKYVWGKNNWIELFDDINMSMSESNNNHFFGSIVLNKLNINDYIKNHYSIIDGQQRILTITIALVAIGLLFSELGDFNTFNGLTKNMLVKNSKGENFPIISKEANVEVYNLVRILVDNAEVREKANMPMITINELIYASKASKKVADCLTYFYDSFKFKINNDSSKLENYKDAILKINYINVTADNQEDAYSIFEALNARGQPLDDFDLLSNYILKNFKEEKKKDVKTILNTIKDLTENVELFLKHYVIHKYGKKSDKDENRPYKIIVKFEKDNDKRKLLEDLLTKAKYYNKIITYADCSDIEYKVFSFFKPRRQQQFRPIVLGLMHQLELNVIQQQTYNDAIMFLYKFFIYYNIIGDQTSNKIEDIVYGYSNKIENQFDEKTIDDMRKSMSERIPDDKESLLNYLKNLRYSNHFKVYSGSKNRENVQAVLEILEKEKGCTLDFNALTINLEHLLPDSETVENSVIGNIMLLEKSINDACTNKSLEQKAGIYSLSQLLTPQYISRHYDEFDANSRMNEMVEQLYNLIITLKN